MRCGVCGAPGYTIDTMAAVQRWFEIAGWQMAQNSSMICRRKKWWFSITNQGLVNVPFWGFWTSLSSICWRLDPQSFFVMFTLDIKTNLWNCVRKMDPVGWLGRRRKKSLTWMIWVFSICHGWVGFPMAAVLIRIPFHLLKVSTDEDNVNRKICLGSSWSIHSIYTLWWFDMVVEHGPFLDDEKYDCPIENGDFPVCKASKKTSGWKKIFSIISGPIIYCQPKISSLNGKVTPILYLWLIFTPQYLYRCIYIYVYVYIYICISTHMGFKLHRTIPHLLNWQIIDVKSHHPH